MLAIIDLLFDSPQSWLIGIIVVGVGLFAFPYVVLPFVVLVTLRFRLPAEVLRVNPQQVQLPDDARFHFHQTYEALVACGFEMRDVLFLPTIVPNVRTMVACYTNRATGDGAISAFMLAESGLTTLRKHHVEFSRRTAAGIVVNTNNSDELSAFPQNPRETTTQFMDLRDIRQLFALHQFLAHKLGRGAAIENRLDSEFHGDCAAYFSRVVFGEMLYRQVETGYLTADSTGLRPTVKGSLLMAWREVWPVKSIRRAARRRAATAALAEFNAAVVTA